ncbi:MAG: acyl carrier protein [Pseudobutyrivibrio sp.]|nr:acyl carrier protein [Pseudobutyrivibrio sp.]
MASILDRLTEVFQDVFDDEDLTITADTNVKELDGWDSLTHITLMAAIQDEFDVKYNIEQITELTTVSDILATLEGEA